MASTLTTFDFAMKELYTKERVADLTLKKSPLMAKMAKNSSFTGEALVVPLIYGAAQGVSGTLARAQTSSAGANNAGNLKGLKFVLQTGEYDGAISIGDKVIKQSRSNVGAFMENKTAEIDSLYEQMGADLAAFLYGNSGNSIGRVSSAYSSGTTITLSEPSQILNFEVGMFLERNTVDGSDGTTAATADTYQVTAVNREAGTITLAAAANIAADNFLFRKGSYRGNTGVFVMHGIQDYVWVDNSPTVIYGMTRTADTQRLAGSRVPAAALAGRGIEERFQLLATYMEGRYGTPGFEDAYLHPEDWINLSIALQGRGIRPLEDSSTQFGYQTIKMVCGTKMVNFYADPFAPKNLGLGLNLKNWKLHSTGELIHPIEEDGLTLLRAATTNDYEYRLVTYPALECNAPGNSGRVALA